MSQLPSALNDTSILNSSYFKMKNTKQKEKSYLSGNWLISGFLARAAAKRVSLKIESASRDFVMTANQN